MAPHSAAAVQTDGAPGCVRIEHLKIDVIRTDAWAPGGPPHRADIDHETVNEYEEDGAGGLHFPPLVVFLDADNNVWLADGFHRLAAHLDPIDTGVECEVREGSRRDAILYAVGANTTHGLRRSNEDKRRCVATMLSDPEWNGWADNAIAQHCKVSDKTVTSVRDENNNFGFPKSTKRKGRDGKERPAKRAKPAPAAVKAVPAEETPPETPPEPVKSSAEETPPEPETAPEVAAPTHEETPETPPAPADVETPAPAPVSNPLNPSVWRVQKKDGPKTLPSPLRKAKVRYQSDGVTVELTGGTYFIPVPGVDDDRRRRLGQEAARQIEAVLAVLAGERDVETLRDATTAPAVRQPTDRGKKRARAKVVAS